MKNDAEHMDLKVCMLVYNHCTNDARVLKEAGTLTDAGYSVRIIAVKSDNTSYYEQRNGFDIYRVDKDPIHIRLLNGRIFFEMFKKKPKSYLSYLKSKANTTNNNATSVSKRNDALIDDNFSLNYRISTIGFRTTLAEEYKTRPAKLFLYNWTLFFLQALKKAFKLTIHALKKAFKLTIHTWIRKMLLTVHTPLCFYDFWIKSMRINAESPSDIYHSHDLNTLYPAYKSAKTTGGKLIYDSHELYIERNKAFKSGLLYKFITSLFEKYLIRKADHVITVGDCIASYLSKKYSVSLPSVIMNAPSIQKADIRSRNIRNELGIPDKMKILIYCGGITFNRGLEKLIESIKLIPGYYLVLMGYGNPDYLEKLKSIAIANNVENRFSFFGPVATDEVTAYTASADLGVAPIENVCLSYYYCAPNKIFEYLVGGIPVIASSFPELQKIVTENNIGYTFDPQDINSIAEAVDKIFFDEEYYLQMKKNTEFAAQKYNWENESVKLLNLYRELYYK